ncbi:MAG: flagellin [Lachnospiraceae bacterium]|nr:flagellin [Lachnospiraceae bacterium]
MVVQHNLTAMNSNRMLGLTTASQAKATEKLSSGYRINRAADDAAGLAISEKMRKQIRGLTQASTNAQDGISAVQTAEGALTEVHDMLQRMNELAVKSANGTQSESDRNAIQSEIDQLVTEIDRVSTTTKFNETYLLKGNNKGDVGKLTYSTANAALSSKFGAVTSNGTITGMRLTQSTQTIGNTTYVVQTFTVQGGSTYSFVSSTSVKAGAGASVTKLNVSEVVKQLNTGSVQAFSNIDDMTSAIKRDYGDDIKSISTYVEASVTNLKIETFADLNDAIDLSLHVGADSSSDNKITLNVNQMSARGLGVNGLNVAGKTGDNATRAIDTIGDALAKVSSQRATLGAVQNRLEHTINNLDNIVENTTSAESAIRDTDMATQMVTYSNNNILAQAGQAMLAQSNQTNQGVLSLLG